MGQAGRRQGDLKKNGCKATSGSWGSPQKSTAPPMRLRTPAPPPWSASPEGRPGGAHNARRPRFRFGRLLLLATGLLAFGAMWFSYLLAWMDGSPAQQLHRGHHQTIGVGGDVPRPVDSSPPLNTASQLPLSFQASERLQPVDTSLLPKDPAFTSGKTITYEPVRAKNQFFVTAGAYLIHGDASRRALYYTSTKDVLLVFIGFGDFDSKTPQPSSDELDGKFPALPPEWQCVLRFSPSSASASSSSSFSDQDSVTLKDGVMHVNGTVYEHRKSLKRNVVYNFIERGVWISFLVPPEVVARLGPMEYGRLPPAQAKFVIPSPWGFDSNWIKPYWFPTHTTVKYAIEPLVLCSSALWNMSGSKFLIEWIEYHLAIGFTHLVLYYDRLGDLPLRVLAHYQAKGVVTLHDWGTILDDKDGFGLEGVGRGVVSRNWEHGQRIARNDCYLRYRHHSAFMGFIDVDELFQSATGHFEDVVRACKDAVASDPMRIACSLVSVTVPPVATVPGRLLLERMPISEAHCQEPYNCGKYHVGRTKYIMRTDVDAVMPPGPIFYHAVSQNYDIADTHHVFLPRSVGNIRHYAGHFIHSRKGGLPVNNRMHNPLPDFALDAILSSLQNDEKLRMLYDEPQSESFLKLDRVEDAWRFAKRGEKPARLPPKPVKRYMTFDLFGGRLNNQIWTYDWVFRVALGLNRTAVLPAPLKREHWIGFPSAATAPSLWNLRLLRKSPVSFNFWWEVDRLPDVASECTWKFSPSNKYLVAWALRVNNLPQCAQRIHFSTADGLVHSYKADTRHLGVDPLMFWRYMQPSTRVMREAKSFVASVSGSPSVGLHARTFLEARQTMDGAKGVCSRLANKLLDNALRRSRALDRCQCQIREQKDSSAWVRRTWVEAHLEDACRITDASIKDVAPVPAGAAFVVATDHETKEMDALFERNGGHMYFYPGSLPEINDAALDLQELGRPMRSLWKGIEPVLVDIGILLSVDVFFGTPSSTLSQAVCLWRRALGLQGSDMCDLVWLSTFSDRCDEMEPKWDCPLGPDSDSETSEEQQSD